ncbi:hypothetical protein EDB81DRAFT_651198, partial [Dactylonectria macrodidyma]
NDIKKQFGHGQRQRVIPARSRVALYGLGGIGKTQIALAYVYWLREMHPDVSVFRVHASNPERSCQGYVSIAKECRIAGFDDPQVDVLPLVKTFLERDYQNRWVMVIDNADDTHLFFQSLQEGNQTCPSDGAIGSEANLGRFIPECAHGSILMTTRNKQAGSRFLRGKPPVKVEEMTGDEIHQLLCVMLDDTSISLDDTLTLSSQLEHLPLALAQAAAFIIENSISINDYVHLLGEGDSSLVGRLSEPFEAVGRDSNTPHALTATWVISFEQIKKQHAFAGEILSLISLFDRQAIPKDFVLDYYRNQRPDNPVDSETAAVLRATGVLQAFSFKIRGKDESIDIHRLVQLVTRKCLAITGRMAEFAWHALRTVSDTYPSGKFETRNVCLRYLSHALAVLDTKMTDSKHDKIARALLLYRTGSYSLTLGHLNDSESYHAKAVKLTESELREYHRITLDIRNKFVITYQRQDRLKESEELLAQILKSNKNVFGDGHLDSNIRCMDNLASIFIAQDRWKEVEELLVYVLKAHKKVLGDDHLTTLANMNNLAITFFGQGRCKEAEDLNLQVLGATKRVLGDNHPDTMAAMDNLASTYYNQGHLKDAEDLELQSLKASKEALGDDHPDTLVSMNNLAHV